MKNSEKGNLGGRTSGQQIPSIRKFQGEFSKALRKEGKPMVSEEHKKTIRQLLEQAKRIRQESDEKRIVDPEMWNIISQ